MRIRTVKLSKIAKSPLTYIAIAAAIAAFAIGLFVSARMNGIAASGPRVVEVDNTDSIIYRNPDGTWPSPIPTSAPPSRLSDDYDAILDPTATGIATMGKLLYLYDGESIQLPSDVYVEKHIDLISCSGTDCPESPVAILARGDDKVAIDRYGKIIPGWSNSPAYKPDRFKFLNE